MQSRKPGQGKMLERKYKYRLPSEAEWEYSARAGTTTRYYFGETITKWQAQFLSHRTVEVGSFPPNQFGLNDMHGNVFEWVADNWHPNYVDAPSDGAARHGGDLSMRVVRGGSWIYSDFYLRSADRGGSRAGSRSSEIGFRVARALLLSPS